MYSGKEICQGCKRPGTEIGRWRKVDLCPECADQMKAGGAELTYSRVEYMGVYQHRNAFRSNELNTLVHALLKAISIEGVEVVDRNRSLKYSFGDNKARYNIPLRFYEPLTDFCLKLESLILRVEGDIEALPGKVRIEVDKERARIFNEGVEHGKDLLFRLNDGTIGMDDFNRRIVSYKNK